MDTPLRGRRAAGRGVRARARPRTRRRHRNDHPLLAGRRYLRDDRVRLQDARKPPARARVPQLRGRDFALRRADRRVEHVPLRGRHPRVRRVPQRDQDGAPRRRHLLRRRVGGHRGRNRHAGDRRAPGVDSRLRQQHQHPRGRHASDRVQDGAHPRRQRLREQPRHAGRPRRRQPPRRGRSRGTHRRHLRQAPRPAVRGPDEDQAREFRGPRHRRERHPPTARDVLRGEPGHGDGHHLEGRRGRPRPQGREAGRGAHPPQVRARIYLAAGEARGLPEPRPLGVRTVHRGGRLRGRVGQAGPRPQVPGDFAPQGEDSERRETPPRPHSRKRRDTGAHHRHWRRRRRRVRHREGALPAAHPDDRRRRRRRAHPDAAAYASVPAHAPAHRGRLRVRGSTAAVPRPLPRQHLRRDGRGRAGPHHRGGMQRQPHAGPAVQGTR
uniref:Uncharacterized 50.6 kDa protein in the 5'region of gyrA and gyrB n=1 Tax=Haloferax lucentense (strain DSM 14919 / JCM 9276 / NCIMB 13854 / Aa 2.2) TaxID=1230452 RepID=YGY3_HALL2|nr:RecName: Full=Uncharacterized 50.6 kDa protein in the 5'region of gyrA and gyrB; AltName: Full=ORF 3 [Haloferax lucentense DSM 14919]pir/C39135/ hypothetical protein 3 (gyrB region) - Haloferax sp [Haloferax sp.]